MRRDFAVFVFLFVLGNPFFVSSSTMEDEAIHFFIQSSAKNQSLDFVIENLPKYNPNDLNFDIVVFFPDKVAEVVVTFNNKDKSTVETLVELKFFWNNLSKDELQGNKPIKLILRKAEIFQ